MAQDTTLQNTLSGTSYKSKPLNTADAKLRRRLIEVQEKYKDEEFTKRALYQIDNYDPEDIQSEMDRYKQMVQGAPAAADEETGRVEDRQRQMLYNDVISTLNEVAVDKNGRVMTDENEQPIKIFNPNDPGDVAALKNDLAANYEGISYDEIVGAVSERLPQQEGGEQAPVEEENIGSDFSFGALDPRSGNSLLGKMTKHIPGWEWLGNGGYGAPAPYEQEVPNDMFQPPQQHRPQVQNQDGSVSTVLSKSFNIDGKEILMPTIINGKKVSDEEAIKHYRKTGENLGKFNSVEEANAAGQRIHEQEAGQVKGARMDSFIQGVEDRFSETKTYDNTMAEPPGLNGMGTVAPNQPPPAEERYPGGVVESWDKPNDVSGLPIEEGKKTYQQSREELKDVDVLSEDYKPRTLSQVPEQEIETYKQYVREVFGDEADLAIQVMLEESKGIAEASGDTDADKVFDYKGDKIGDSVGLFQIRTGGKNWPGKSRAEVAGIPVSEFRNNMLDPYQNIRFAKYLRDKEGWEKWSTYNTAKKKLNK